MASPRVGRRQSHWRRDRLFLHAAPRLARAPSRRPTHWPPDPRSVYYALTSTGCQEPGPDRRDRVKVWRADDAWPRSIDNPPSTSSVSPTMYELASLARNTTACATSSAATAGRWAPQPGSAPALRASSAHRRCRWRRGRAHGVDPDVIRDRFLRQGAHRREQAHPWPRDRPRGRRTVLAGDRAEVDDDATALAHHGGQDRARAVEGRVGVARITSSRLGVVDLDDRPPRKTPALFTRMSMQRVRPATPSTGIAPGR